MVRMRLMQLVGSKRTGAQPQHHHHLLQQQQSPHVPRSSSSCAQKHFQASRPSPYPSVAARLAVRKLLLPRSLLEFPEHYTYQQRRDFAKAKKSKGEDEFSSTYVDVYPTVKENLSKQMEAALEALSRELSKLRTGRASAGLLDHVNVVDNNGVRSSLTNIAAVTVVDNERLRVTPFDPSNTKCVERGIRASPLKLNPVTDGDIVTVSIPKPTKEHLETMAKVVGKAGETSKVSIRRARQMAMDAIKASTGNVSKDDIKRREKEVEDLTKKYVKTVDDNCKAKEKEMLG